MTDAAFPHARRGSAFELDTRAASQSWPNATERRMILVSACRYAALRLAAGMITLHDRQWRGGG